MRGRALFILAIALPTLPSPATAMDPATAGEIEAEIQYRRQEIAKEYEGRVEGQPSHQERRERDTKERAAIKEILESHGVSEKGYARSRMGLSGEKRAEANEAGKAWKEKKEADQKTAAEKAKGEAKASEIPVQRGFDPKNPPTYGEDGTAVQKGFGREKGAGKEKTFTEVPVPRASEAPQEGAKHP